MPTFSTLKPELKVELLYFSSLPLGVTNLDNNEE